MAAMILFAHEGMEHVMGTIRVVTKSSVTVETVQHKIVTVLIGPSTKFLESHATSELKNLNVGDRVVIHAKPDAEKRLVAVTVEWMRR